MIIDSPLTERAGWIELGSETRKAEAGKGVAVGSGVLVIVDVAEGRGVEVNVGVDVCWVGVMVGSLNPRVTRFIWVVG